VIKWAASHRTPQLQKLSAKRRLFRASQSSSNGLLPARISFRIHVRCMNNRWNLSVSESSRTGMRARLRHFFSASEAIVQAPAAFTSFSAFQHHPCRSTDSSQVRFPQAKSCERESVGKRDRRSSCLSEIVFRAGERANIVAGSFVITRDEGTAPKCMATGDCCAAHCIRETDDVLTVFSKRVRCFVSCELVLSLVRQRVANSASKFVHRSVCLKLLLWSALCNADGGSRAPIQDGACFFRETCSPQSSSVSVGCVEKSHVHRQALAR
jgi:hypothetical protein